MAAVTICNDFGAQENKACHCFHCFPIYFPWSDQGLSNESVLHIRWPKYWSFSFNISPSSEYSGLISFSIDWLDLLAVQGTHKCLLQHHSSKASILWCSGFFRASLVAQRLKRLPAMWETLVRSLGWEDPLEKEMATHSSILAWRIPWTKEPGRLQSTGSQRVRHDWATSLSLLPELICQPKLSLKKKKIPAAFYLD